MYVLRCSETRVNESCSNVSLDLICICAYACIIYLTLIYFNSLKLMLKLKFKNSCFSSLLLSFFSNYERTLCCKDKNANSTWGSQAVTHPSTNQAQCCLTSVIERELVFSTWYGRCRESWANCWLYLHIFLH